MPGFQYKQYTDEESEIYNRAIAKIREALSKGLDFNPACSEAPVEDAVLKAFIMDDALKIVIAEMHYGQGLPLGAVAETIKVPLKTVVKASSEMLEDAGQSAAEFYRQTQGGGQVGTA